MHANDTIHAYAHLLIALSTLWKRERSKMSVDERGVCCEIPWERVPYLSALEVWSWQGAIQIHVYFYLYRRP